MQAGATPRDRHCPFCTAGAAPRFGLRGGMVAASLMGLGACGPSAAEEQARQQAIQQEEAQRAESLRQAAAIEAAEAAERARAVEVAAAEAAAAEAAAAEAAAQLGIGYYTADEYIRSVYVKLQVRSRGSAIAKAVKEGLV